MRMRIASIHMLQLQRPAGFALLRKLMETKREVELAEPPVMRGGP